MGKANHEAVQILILALLAVNNYSLEKVYDCRNKFEQEGILNLEKVSNWTNEGAAEALARAGYDRGPFMNALFADRLLSTCRFLQEGGLNGFSKAVESRSISEVASTLKDVRGVGPVVLRNFSFLMDWE